MSVVTFLESGHGYCVYVQDNKVFADVGRTVADNDDLCSGHSHVAVEVNPDQLIDALQRAKQQINYKESEPVLKRIMRFFDPGDQVKP